MHGQLGVKMSGQRGGRMGEPGCARGEKGRNVTKETGKKLQRGVVEACKQRGDLEEERPDGVP